MVRSEPSEGKKFKPRGRAFPKGNNKGKLRNEVLASPGSQISDEGGIITPLPKETVTEDLKQSYDQMETQQKDVLKEEEKTGCEVLGIDPPILLESAKMHKIPENVVIDSMEFMQGTNCLKIVLFKRHNRMYRIQIFLNDSEIRPNTYTGATSALPYWNLLKGSLKK